MSAAVLLQPSWTTQSGIAGVLSPSQVSTWQMCEARWAYKYISQLPDTRTPALALGSAAHAAMSATWHHKLDTGIDLPMETIIEKFAASWLEQSSTVEFTGKDNREEMAKQGAVMLERYMLEAEPKIHPQAVDYEVRGTIAGVPVRGFIDLVEADGTIVDLKTAGRTPSAITPAHLFQMTTYAQLAGKELDISGQAREDTLVKLKSPKLVQIQHEIGLADYHYVRAVYPLVQEQMRQGLYSPNRASFLCSRTKCAYWRQCEAEYGGRVPGGEADD